MSESHVDANDQEFQTNMMTSFIQIATLVLLVSLCVMIIGPFGSIVTWGIILAVAVYPLHLKLASWFGGNSKASSTFITLLGLLILLLPGWMVASSSIESARDLASEIQSGTLSIPPPRERVAEWPVVGETIHEAWSELSENSREFFKDYEAQVRRVGQWSIGVAGSMLFGLLGFVASVIIAGVLLMYPTQGYELSRRIYGRISPNRGDHLANLSIATIRSVTNGVLGVAVIQAGLALVGFVLIGLPAVGLLTLIILVVGIIQLPALVIMAPIIAWVYSFADPVAASIFAVYAIVVALSDNVLKPLLLGRGVDLPALVVLIGAIGGMLTFGIIGLFIGAVILGLGYRIISDWIWQDPSEVEDVVADNTAGV